LIPLKPQFIDFARQIASQLTRSRIRADIDDRDESVDKRVREAELNWVPYVAVVGKRELEAKVIAIRRRKDGRHYNTTIHDLVREISELTVGFPQMPLKLPISISQRPGYKQIG
jgi:threonyl-tRNA synthetase